MTDLGYAATILILHIFMIINSLPFNGSLRNKDGEGELIGQKNLTLVLESFLHKGCSNVSLQLLGK